MQSADNLYFRPRILTKKYFDDIIQSVVNRGVAQLVAHTSGGRDAAGSSPVTPTKKIQLTLKVLAVFFLARVMYA